VLTAHRKSFEKKKMYILTGSKGPAGAAAPLILDFCHSPLFSPIDRIGQRFHIDIVAPNRSLSSARLKKVGVPMQVGSSKLFI